jgi:hypothetical protein
VASFAKMAAEDEFALDEKLTAMEMKAVEKRKLIFALLRIEMP